MAPTRDHQPALRASRRSCGWSRPIAKVTSARSTSYPECVDEPALTPTQILAVTFAVVLIFGVLFSRSAFKGLERLLFRCRRCDHEFRRAAYRRFPKVCPHCGAADWQL